MTAYHGGKQRIGQELAEVIVDAALYIADKDGMKIRGYCEPFCGMLGVYRHIPFLFEDEDLDINYKAGDANKSVVMMWKSAQNGWRPPSNVSEKQFNALKYARDSALKGYVGHQYSFGGQYFKGYAPKYGHTLKSYKNISDRIESIVDDLYDVKFSPGSYTQFSNLKGYVIYCDPPYEDTTQYYKKSFDSREFYEWCRDMARYNIVIVSGYNAPKDFEKIYSKNLRLTTSGFKRTENLYLV